MERKWTEKQSDAIKYNERNILVSAAAGSGKTAVLVERIISMITDPERDIDIDRLVVVTFTKAAAASMKEKIRKELDKRLDETPGDKNLLRQITLLNNAQITTIDSFCLWIIKNHFAEVNLDPGFRTMDEGERKLVESDVLEEVLEELYASNDESFFNLVDAFGLGRDDSGLVEIIEKIYRFARSNPWPDEWFEAAIKVYEDASDDNSVLRMLYENIIMSLNDYKTKYEEYVRYCSADGGPHEYLSAIQSDLTGINSMLNANNFSELNRKMRLFSFETLSRKSMKEVEEYKKKYIKGQRDSFKKYINTLIEKILIDDTDELYKDLKSASTFVKKLLDITKLYMDRVSETKRDKGLIDFNDMEHLALSVLVKKEDGVTTYTETADRLSERFHEVLIDEYQDSNMLQEVILNAVSRNRFADKPGNIYMVGDVKQSIYKFRLACPELFMSKFDTYTWYLSDNVRIELNMNFRSRANILHCTNDVFSRVMNRAFCGIKYDDSHKLTPGFPYDNYKCDDNNFGLDSAKETEIILIDSKEEEELKSREIEGRALAGTIKEIVESGVKVFDAENEEYRPISYKDIVILTRSVNGWADTFANCLMNENIPVYTDVSEGYFNVREIQIILSMLTVIDNPCQEIPLAAALVSYFGGLSARELGMVRAYGKKMLPKGVHNNLYEQLKCVAGECDTDLGELQGKCSLFLSHLNEYREKSSLVSIYDLCWEMIYDSGYYDYVGTMPAGRQRQANLNVLLERAMAYGGSSFKGLFNFLRYIDRLKKFDEDFQEGSASLDNDDVVTIMSIHKSKGLEFPVVILAGAHKKINNKDSQGSVLVDRVMGIGIDNVDITMRTKRPTILKGAMASQIVKETISEEERLLYVAMTRAREKLIVTGVVSDAANVIEKYKQKADNLMLEETFSYADSENIKTYLDMIMPVCLLDKEALDGKFNIKIKTPKDYMCSEAEEETTFESGVVTTGELMQLSLQDLPEYVPDKNASLKAKITVSELKAMQHDLDFDNDALESDDLKAAKDKLNKEEGEPGIVPKFIKGEEEVLKANERGTAYHRVMECLDYELLTDEESVRKNVDDMLQTNLINRKQADSINVKDIYTFVGSDIGRRVKEAFDRNQVKREQPFVFLCDGQLVQGVIDLYFEEPDGLVIVDYKTDRVPKSKSGEEELKSRYAIQLEYYADALERLTGKPVKEKVIFSFALGKEIFLE